MQSSLGHGVSTHLQAPNEYLSLPYASEQIRAVLPLILSKEAGFIHPGPCFIVLPEVGIFDPHW